MITHWNGVVECVTASNRFLVVGLSFVLSHAAGTGIFRFVIITANLSGDEGGEREEEGGEDSLEMHRGWLSVRRETEKA